MWVIGFDDGCPMPCPLPKLFEIKKRHTPIMKYAFDLNFTLNLIS